MVTRYFEENAKKYRESPDETGLCDWGRMGECRVAGGSESSDISASMRAAIGKIIGRTGQSRGPVRISRLMRANLPGRAASCVRRSKIKEKAGKPCGPARHVRAVRKFSGAGFVP
ncbi:TPA: hypothetical protein ACK3RK_000197 [Burkholderia cepacia]